MTLALTPVVWLGKPNHLLLCKSPALPVVPQDLGSGQIWVITKEKVIDFPVKLCYN
jgi:hypothetical protein